MHHECIACLLHEIPYEKDLKDLARQALDNWNLDLNPSSVDLDKIVNPGRDFKSWEILGAEDLLALERFIGID